MIGRKNEKEELLSALEVDESQFVAVYGRRRVGKTYLIREAFNYQFPSNIQVWQRGLLPNNWQSFRNH